MPVEETVDEGLVKYVEHLALHVDRLFIAGHQAASRYAPTVAREFDLSGFGVLIDLRRLFLRLGRTTVDECQAIERYVGRSSLVAMLEQHQNDGLLSRDALEIQCLTVLCHMEGPRSVIHVAVQTRNQEEAVGRSLRSLVERGWAAVSEEGWRVTTEGRERRGHIEGTTNQRSALPFGILSDGDRDRFAAILASLPESVEPEHET